MKKGLKGIVLINKLAEGVELYALIFIAIVSLF